jgi:hypothetical protein
MGSHSSYTGLNKWFIELDDGKIYRKPLYLMVKTMVSCRFSLKPIQWWWVPQVPLFFGSPKVAISIERV